MYSSTDYLDLLKGHTLKSHPQVQRVHNNRLLIPRCALSCIILEIEHLHLFAKATLDPIFTLSLRMYYPDDETAVVSK